MKTYTLEEICVQSRLDRDRVVTLVRREWIRPVGEQIFDEEDLRRLQLILELERDFRVNEEGVEIILHLLDQLHSITSRAG